MPKKGYSCLTVRREVAEALRAGAKAVGLRVSEFLRLLLASVSKDCPLEPRTRVQIPAGALKTTSKQGDLGTVPGTVPRGRFECG